MTKSATFDISVVPRSSRSEIILNNENKIKIYLNSPPSDGRANEELVKLISKKMHIPKSSIKIIIGEKSRQKKISIEGIAQEDILKLFKR